MSTVPPATPTPPHTPAPPTTTSGYTVPPPTGHGPREIKLISHSTIFYWWPIWVLGYAMALITYVEGHRLAILPAGTKLEVTGYADEAKRIPNAYRLDVKGSTVPLERASAFDAKDEAFKPRVSQKAWMGPLYCVILLLTILITNVPLRGLWSFLVLMVLLILALALSLIPNGWENVLGAFGNLHIYINMAGYLFIATTVLILWVVSVFIFDQRTFMVISPGQLKVCEHIGDSVRNFDTTGLAFEKQRDDLFRHWILGFFSGDLIVRTSGAEKEEIRFPNVLWIGYRLEEVSKILRERAVVSN